MEESKKENKTPKYKDIMKMQIREQTNTKSEKNINGYVQSKSAWENNFKNHEQQEPHKYINIKKVKEETNDTNKETENKTTFDFIAKCMYAQVTKLNKIKDLWTIKVQNLLKRRI